MGGGGSSEQKETSYEKAAADVAQKEWNLYTNELSQYEDNFIERVGNYNSDSNMANAKSDVDVNYNSAYSDTRDQLADNMAASGINPNSGKFQENMADTVTDQAENQADTVDRAQSSEQDKYIAGLQDVTAMGMGEKGDALSGLSDVANMSASKAASDAQDDFNKRASNQQLAGAVAGAGLSSYQNSLKSSGTGLSSYGSDGYSSYSLSSNKEYNPQSNTYFGGR
ncbi:hypothetical protein [Vibrio salinus]|uniref:hypothetical protein n=1 Tax=Vibrio salinus TaxID=2899784 RepID=UPI001E3A1EE1|nr:hypothetical protein [Vibrio salinus]MCE0495781.1 hypothetical protein [Vibrio salinus]